MAKKIASSWGRQVGSNRAPNRWLSVIRTRSSGLSWTAPKAAANSSEATSRTQSPPSTSGPGGRTATRAAMSVDGEQGAPLARGWKTVGVKQARQVLKALDQARARCGVQLAGDGVDGLVRHGGHHIPARPRGDHLRGLRIEWQVSVGQDDHFRVALDDRLRADLPEITWQVAEDIRATRQIDQLPLEPLWSSHQRL